MIQSRHFYAFFISTLSFVLFYFAFLSLSKIEKVLKPKAQRVIKVAIVTPPKEIVPAKVAVPLPIPPAIIPKPQPPKEVVKPKPIVKPKPVVKKVVKPKPKPKKVIKKKVVKKKPVVKKPVPKKVVKKKVVKKPVIKKPVVHEPIVKEVVAQPMPMPEPVYVQPAPVYRPVQPVVQPTSAPAPVAKVRDDRHKQAFLQNVRSQIMANKKYPKIAKRRHIEGSVKIRFDITSSGQVSNIRFINGKSIFQKSIRKTLENTFPMAIPQNVKADLPIMNISVVLHFNLR